MSETIETAAATSALDDAIIINNNISNDDNNNINIDAADVENKVKEDDENKSEQLPEPPALHTTPLDEETIAKTDMVLQNMGYAPLSDRPGAEWRRPQHSKSHSEPLPIRKKKQHRHCLLTIAGPTGTPDVATDAWFMTFLGTLPTEDAVKRRMKQCRRCQPSSHYVFVPSYEWVLMPPAKSAEEHEERLMKLFQKMDEQRCAKDDEMEKRISDVRMHRQKVRADIAQSFIDKINDPSSSSSSSNENTTDNNTDPASDALPPVAPLVAPPVAPPVAADVPPPPPPPPASSVFTQEYDDDGDNVALSDLSLQSQHADDILDESWVSRRESSRQFQQNLLAQQSTTNTTN